MNFSRSFGLEVGVVLLALVGLAGCGVRSGDSAYAEGSEAYARRDYMRAIRAFDESVQLSPKNTDAWFMLARAQLDVGDIPAAREAVRMAALCASGTTNVVACGEADIIELAGQIAYHAKDYASARAAYTQLTKTTYPSKIRARGFCGLAVLDMAGIVGSAANENCARARVNLMEALRLDNSNAAARYHLGRLYRDAYDYRESALDQFKLFVLLEKSDAERVQRVQRHFIPNLQEAIVRAAAEQSGADKRNSAASAAALKRAEEAWRKRNYKPARRHYNDAYVADVLSFPAALGLAKSWEKTDSSATGLKEALKYYRRAAQLRPSSRDTLMTVGDLAMKVNNPVTAVEAYSRALAARPSDVIALDKLIVALQKTGDKKSAAVYSKYRDSLFKRKK